MSFFLFFSSSYFYLWLSQDCPSAERRGVLPSSPFRGVTKKPGEIKPHVSQSPSSKYPHSKSHTSRSPALQPVSDREDRKLLKFQEREKRDKRKKRERQKKNKQTKEEEENREKKRKRAEESGEPERKKKKKNNDTREKISRMKGSDSDSG
jgi:hypothetical protein